MANLKWYIHKGVVKRDHCNSNTQMYLSLDSMISSESTTSDETFDDENLQIYFESNF